MPNYKVLKEADRLRRRKRRSAKRLHRRYRQQVPILIRQLGTTQAAHDRDFDLLSKMGDTIVTELLEALADPALDPIAADEVVSLLGAAGDQRARAALWAFFEQSVSQLPSWRVGTLTIQHRSIRGSATHAIRGGCWLI